jgi:KUP system potassium uptake protein
MQPLDRQKQKQLGLVIAVLGVVYGDLGTSPLYALRECFHGRHAIAPSSFNVLGVLSLVFWSLILIVSIKYLVFVLRADNRGEGGILAILPLALPERKPGERRRGYSALIAVGVFGAALLYGDGIITPAISVLSAVEGIKIAAPAFDRFILPVTVVVLVALFSFQRAGTGRVGITFGPIMLIWFLALAILGVVSIWRQPSVLAAVNPFHALNFFLHHGWSGLVILGAVVLVLTGSEALYADLGHFGKHPIRLAWFAVALPSLLLNYFGQGALLLQDPSAAENPFYRLAPSWALYPLLALATAAAIIASQALISGAFSLTMQAIQLGYAPRMEIDHTSSTQRGQIYLPLVNTALMLLSISLVLGFRSSSNMAAAYGMAVTLTMLITTVLFYFASRNLWGWSQWRAGLLCGVFLVIESAFLSANVLKIASGGWFPLIVALILFSVMSTWKKGRRILSDKMQESALPVRMLLEDLQRHAPHRVRGTAVYMSGHSDGTPVALLHNLKHNKVLHERVVLLTIATQEVPHVDPSQRLGLERYGEGFFRVTGQYGFMEDANVLELMQKCAELGLEFKIQETTFFLSSETIIAKGSPEMAYWRARLFAFLARNAQRATAFFRLPANRVVELGMQIEL